MELIRDRRVKDAFMNSTIQNMFDRGELRSDHPLQRKPGRWSKGDKDGLIATVLKGEDIDSVKVCEQITPNGVTLWLIDGLQRLTILSSYRNNAFRLGAGVELPIVRYQRVKKSEDGKILKDEFGGYLYEIVEYDLRGKGYNDLPVELKEKFDNYKIDVVKHLDCTDEEIGYNIRRYNKQKSMNASENAVTYMDSTAKDVKRISRDNRFFKDCGAYTELERNNGTIDRIVIETIMCMFHLDRWKKSGKAMGAFVNQNSSKEEFEILDDNLCRLEQVISEDLDDIFTSKDSFIWITLFNKFSEMGLEDSRFADFLSEFKNNLAMRRVNGELFYEIDRDGSTKDKAVIIRKLNLLNSLMHKFFHIEDESASVTKCEGGSGDGAGNLEREEKDLTEENDLKGGRVDPGKADILEFVRKNVSPDIMREDIELYSDMLEDLSLNVDNKSRLLEERNRPSLIAVIGYACGKDLDLDEWFVDFFGRESDYRTDQRENYLYMRADLNGRTESIEK